MNNYKKNEGFGGNGFKGGFKNRGGGGFKDRNGGGRDFGRNAEMHQAVCAGCGKSCEVPFRPNGKKPVYCKECFALQGGGAPSDRSDRPSRDFQRRDDRGGNDRGNFEKKYNAPHQSHQSESPRQSQGNLDDLKKQFETMNSKLDRLISLAETFLPKKEVSAPAKSEAVSEKTEKTEKIAKKAATKKVSKKK